MAKARKESGCKENLFSSLPIRQVESFQQEGWQTWQGYSIPWDKYLGLKISMYVILCFCLHY